MTEKRKITSIEPQKRNPHRRSIFLDGEFAFGLDEELVFKYGLHEGDELDGTELITIIAAEEKKYARDLALRFLSYRARSEKEVRDRLHKAGVGDETVESVLDDLKQAKLLDDRQFVIAFVHDKMTLRPVGPLLIRQELFKLGIRDALIDLAIEEAFREKTQVAVALELLIKRYPQVKQLDWLKAKKRLVDFLCRRGFKWEVIKEAFEQFKLRD